MDVIIMATKDCSHCKNLSRELDDIGIEHSIVYCEDNPGLVRQYSIRHSPNLIVNGELAFRRQPSEEELKKLFIC